MPISLTCSCGARLEIDDKFAGQKIACPDCNRPILAEPPPPAATRTSGLAILSLLFALVGAFTVVGTLAAIACGAVACRQLTRRREPVGGLRIAQAGIILGAVFTAISLYAYTSRSLLGLDSLYRQFVWAGKLKPQTGPTVTARGVADDSSHSLERPAGPWTELNLQTTQKEGENLFLVNIRDDAFLLWLSITKTDDDDPGTLRSRAVDTFRDSEFRKMIGRLPEPPGEPIKQRDVNDTTREFLIDMVLSGVPRTFLFRVIPEGPRVQVLIGGARTPRFAGLADVFRHSFDSFKQEIGP